MACGRSCQRENSEMGLVAGINLQTFGDRQDDKEVLLHLERPVLSMSKYSA